MCYSGATLKHCVRIHKTKALGMYFGAYETMEQESLQANIGSDVVCKCGRVYTHCMACGQRKPYVKKKRSAELSFELRKRVWVYSCTNCPVETHSGMECQAPPVDTGAGYRGVAYQKSQRPQELPPWGHSLPGSAERGSLLVEWVLEMQAKHKWGPVQVYVEAQKAGWQLEAFAQVDEDVIQACRNQGLWPVEVPMRGEPSQVTVDEKPLTSSAPQEPVGLDEIIRAMQEEQR